MLNRSSQARLQFGSWLLKFVLPAIFVVAGVAIFTLLGATAPRKLVGQGGELSAVLQRIPIVEVGYVQPYDPSQTLDVEANGVVVPLREIAVAAEVAGRIVYKNERCRAGNFVEEGTLLFRVDDQDYRLEVERLAAQRQSEYSQQQELEQEISNTQRVVEVAEQELALQQREIERLNDLPAGIASGSELDTARRARLASLNALTTTQNQLALLRSRRRRIELAEKLAATELRQAEVNLARTEVRAPITGMIVSEDVQADSFVQRGTSLCVMEDISAAEVSCSLQADQLAVILDQSKDRVETLLPAPPAAEAAADEAVAAAAIGVAGSYALPPTPVVVRYRLAGRDDVYFEWDGVLDRYEGVGIDVQSRTIAVRVRIEDPRASRVVRRGSQGPADGPDSRLVPTLLRGMFVEVIFKTRPSQPLVMVPKLAVRPGGEVWKFHRDPEALAEMVARANADSRADSVEADPAVAAAKPVGGPRPEEWDVGRIDVIDRVQLVRLIESPSPATAPQRPVSVKTERAGATDGDAMANAKANEPTRAPRPISRLTDSQGYWAIQADPELPVGSAVVITPLAAIVGDGSDVVRTDRVEER